MWWDFLIFVAILIAGFWALNELVGGHADKKFEEDMRELTTKEALLEVGTASTLDQDYINDSIPISIAIFKGKLVAIEWKHKSGITYWDDENIASVSTIIELKL